MGIVPSCVQQGELFIPAEKVCVGRGKALDGDPLLRCLVGSGLLAALQQGLDSSVYFLDPRSQLVRTSVDNSDDPENPIVDPLLSLIELPGDDLLKRLFEKLLEAPTAFSVLPAISCSATGARDSRSIPF